MKKLIFSSKFKKDVKYYTKKHISLASLELVLYLLKNDIKLPPKFKQHRLNGDKSNYMECHIKGDILLLYIGNDCVIELLRLASHDKLFK